MTMFRAATALAICALWMPSQAAFAQPGYDLLCRGGKKIRYEVNVAGARTEFLIRFVPGGTLRTRDCSLESVLGTIAE